MIFITVGTWKFDGLIKTVDTLIAEGVIKEEVFAQIGNGDYIPKHCKYARFLKDFINYIEKSDTVISHGGSTIFQVLEKNKRLIAIANPDVMDQHQKHIIEVFYEKGCLIWCRDVKDLRACILDKRPLRPYHPQYDSLAKDILNFLV